MASSALRFLLSAMAVLAAVLSLAPIAPAEEITLDGLLRVQSAVQENYDRVRLALVAIQCNGGTASGIIVSPAGLILTAAHVVESAGHKAKITLHDGKTVEATSLGVDTATDAAMIQLPAPARAWPYISISREVRDLATGQWCFAMGHPGGWEPERGPVLRIGRLVKIAPNMVQSDCVLMGGDSGGVLCNLSGEVIGINSQIWRGRDQNLHVSMAPFLRSWDALRRGDTITSWAQGAGGWIGLSTVAADGVLRIQAVAPDSPAGKAGLRQDDLILSVNNKKLAAPGDFSDVIQQRRAGDLVTLKVRTATGERIIEVKLGKKPQE